MVTITESSPLKNQDGNAQSSLESQDAPNKFTILDPNTPFIREVVRYQKWSLFLIGVTTIATIAFLEVLCFIQSVCWETGSVEVASVVSGLMIPLAILTLIVLAITYEAAHLGARIFFFLWRFVIGIYGIVFIALGVIVLIVGGSVSTDGRAQVWNTLSPYSKIFYNSSISNMNKIYRTNMVLTGIFAIAIGILFVIKFFVIFAYYLKMPEEWHQPTNSRFPPIKSIIDKINRIDQSAPTIIIKKRRSKGKSPRKSPNKKDQIKSINPAPNIILEEHTPDDDGRIVVRRQDDPQERRVLS